MTASDSAAGVDHWHPPQPGVHDGYVLEVFLDALGAEDPKLLARSILLEFGSISAMLGASRWRLRRNMPKKIARAIAESRELMKVALKEVVAFRPLLNGVPGLLDYLRLSSGILAHERLIAIYLDHSTRLIKIVNLQDGSSGEVTFSAQPIMLEALAIGAAGIVLVHNHPSGDPAPSRADLDITRRLKEVGETLDVALIDHLIVARDKVWSWRRGGVLDRDLWFGTAREEATDDAE